MVLPPLTFAPSWTNNVAEAGRSTSTRDPKRINPIRWPRSSESPGPTQQTIRLAKRPAICLTTIGVPPALKRIELRSLD